MPLPGASGQLGRLVLNALLEKIAPDQIVALVRDSAKQVAMAARGMTVRQFDYSAPTTLTPPLKALSACC